MLTAINFKNRLLALQTNMLNFAYSLTANRDDAYDLLQDTTVKALESREKYLENTNFKGWIFTIMRNLFINRYRATVRAGVVIDRSEDLFQLNLSQESGIESPEGAISTAEIRLAMSRLAPDIRRPFTLYVQGYRYNEIAQELGVPLGTVKSRIFVARRKLQSALEDFRYDR